MPAVAILIGLLIGIHGFVRGAILSQTMKKGERRLKTMADKIENPCEGCPWRMPETCKVCAKEPDRKLPDGSPEPLFTRYGIFYVTKLSMD